MKKLLIPMLIIIFLSGCASVPKLPVDPVGKITFDDDGTVSIYLDRPGKFVYKKGDVSCEIDTSAPSLLRTVAEASIVKLMEVKQ